jgi:ABC-type multidrug transport system permease subunit
MIKMRFGTTLEELVSSRSRVVLLDPCFGGLAVVFLILCFSFQSPNNFHRTLILILVYLTKVLTTFASDTFTTGQTTLHFDIHRLATTSKQN